VFNEIQYAQSSGNSVASSMKPKEQALSSMLAAFAGVPLGCFALHDDGRLSDDRRNGFYRLGNDALRVQQRVDSLLVAIVASPAVKTDDLDALAGAAKTATTALGKAATVQNSDTLLDASSKAASVTDLLEGLLDRVD
jgi:hypothetical protein